MLILHKYLHVFRMVAGGRVGRDESLIILDGIAFRRYKNNTPYSLDPSRSTLLSSGTMLITNAVRQDAGVYTCTATLGAEVIRATATVTIRG